MKKLEVPDVLKDLERIYRRVDEKAKKFGLLSDNEIESIIRQSRKKKKGR